MTNLYTLIPALLIIGTCLFSYLGFTNRVIFDRYQFQVGQVRYNKQYYRLITSGFLHADWGHLFFNMFTLYFFARPIMFYYGVFVFVWLYIGSIVAGNAFSLWLYKNRPSYAAIGASGGVSGVLFAAIALAPTQTIGVYFIPVTAWIFLLRSHAAQTPPVGQHRTRRAFGRRSLGHGVGCHALAAHFYAQHCLHRHHEPAAALFGIRITD